MENQQIRIAILDLYNNEPNEGMRGICSILERQRQEKTNISWTIFNVRQKGEIPSSNFDIYISSGGPGSPEADPNAQWEKDYFKLMDHLLEINKSDHVKKKFIFLICHSFQLMCRHLELGKLKKRKSKAYGIFPIHRLEGVEENCFENLPNPFYVVDSRDWQITQPKQNELQQFGATLLAIEKERSPVELERAMMGIRFTNEMIGTQFHPEVDPIGMLHYLMREDINKQIIENHGQEKFDEMVLHLNDDDKIKLTQHIILPTFLKNAIQSLEQEIVNNLSEPSNN